MAELYGGTHYALYAQVALWDHGDPNSYPEWFTGEEPAVVGERGVAVATAEDADVAVRVLEAEAPAGSPVAEGTISVGDEGLDVGNLVAADVAHVEWPGGRTGVRVYTDGAPDEVASVTFVLERLD